MHRLLHENFFGSFDIEGVADDYKGNFTLHYCKNGELLYFYRYKDSKLFEQKDFDREEKHRRVFEYHDNYKISTVYNKSGEISSRHIIFDNHFNISESTSYLINGNEGWEKKADQAGMEEICFKDESYNIVYRFENKLPVQFIFDIAGYEQSYIINSLYDEQRRVVYRSKKLLNDTFEHMNEERWLEYEDDLVIESIHQDNEKNYKITQYDAEKRPLKIVSFNSENCLELVKKYIKTPDEQNLLPIMNIIRLEVFKYDKFGNRTIYEEKYYRPDFSKKDLACYIQDYKYYDKYNIEYGYFDCKTKEDYDNCSEDLTRLEYSENEVRQYRDDQLIAIYYIENERKIKAEFFRYYSVVKEEDEEGNPGNVMRELDIIEKYDTFGNTVESWIKNSATGQEDHYEVKIIRN